MTSPHFLFVELAGEHSNQVHVLELVARATQREGGTCFAYAPAGRVAGLEPGTVAAGIMIAKFTDPAQLLRAAKDSILPLLESELAGSTTPLVLSVEALPEDGLPGLMDIPTIASVPRPPDNPRNTFLVVRGSATDPERMNAYRDVILPMHKQRGGYYEVFALNAGQVKVLSGQWTQQIFAISRWPSRAAAEDFWFCDQYQQTAIPLRLGAGTFTVHLIEAT
jgi:uncharacterized protein (DUF1330 family)